MEGIPLERNQNERKRTRVFNNGKYQLQINLASTYFCRQNKLAKKRNENTEGSYFSLTLKFFKFLFLSLSFIVPFI